MKLGSHLLIGTAALAFAALPLNLESIAFGSLESSSAFAKSDRGGGNGNGGGNGGGRGHSGDHGKSGDAGGRGKAGGVARSGGPGGPKAIAGENSRGAKGKKATDTRVAKSTKTKSTKNRRAEIDMAALPDIAPLPEPKQKNLHARLAGLNSLNRNYRAYLNSKSPRMASIRAFVMASANLDIANANLVDAQTDFQAALDDANLQAFDQAPGVYDDPSLQDLQDRLDVLEHATVAPEDMAAWQAEVDGLRAVLDSEEAQALSDAEQQAEAAAVGTDDEALREALVDAANRNRIAQYGDDYVNDDVMDWAKDVLGVGDRVGKIDEVRETLEVDSQ